MHKPQSVLKNEIHSILWNFEIQTYPLIQVRRPYLVLIKKKRIYRVDFAILTDHRVKIKESEELEKYLDLA